MANLHRSLPAMSATQPPFQSYTSLTPTIIASSGLQVTMTDLGPVALCPTISRSLPLSAQLVYHKTLLLSRLTTFEYVSNYVGCQNFYYLTAPSGSFFITTKGHLTISKEPSFSPFILKELLIFNRFLAHP